MGLTITSFPVIEGLTTIDNVYVNIRDVKYHKDGNEYILNFLCYYQRDDIIITHESLNEIFTEFYDGNIWSKAYEILKKHLTEKSLLYQDC